MDARNVRTTMLVACAFASSGCGSIASSFLQQVQGSGVAASESRKIHEGFTKIQDDGAANVDVRVGQSVSVRVEGDDNIVPLVKTSVEGDTLVIKTKKSIRPKKKLLVTVTLPQLHEIQLDGAGNISVNGVNGGDFKVGLDGAGNITANGTASSLSASLDGAGNLKLSNLKADTASATVDGAGNIDLWVTRSLTANVDGVGNIRYKGHPQVSKSVDGVGRVSAVD